MQAGFDQVEIKKDQLKRPKQACTYTVPDYHPYKRHWLYLLHDSLLHSHVEVSCACAISLFAHARNFGAFMLRPHVVHACCALMLCPRVMPSCCACMLCPHVVPSCCACTLHPQTVPSCCVLMLYSHVAHARCVWSCALMLCPHVAPSCCVLMLALCAYTVASCACTLCLWNLTQITPHTLPATENRLKEMRRQKEDEVCKRIVKYCQRGWERGWERAKQAVWWPGISKQLEKLVSVQTVSSSECSGVSLLSPHPCLIYHGKR